MAGSSCGPDNTQVPRWRRREAGVHQAYLAGFTHGEADKVVLAAAVVVATRGELLEGLHGGGGAHGVDAAVVVALVVDLVVVVGGLCKKKMY